MYKIIHLIKKNTLKDFVKIILLENTFKILLKNTFKYFVKRIY